MDMVTTTSYPGEHAAILAPGTWERVQSLITQRTTCARGKSRNKHLALLSGLLYCESCATRMVYSYSGNPLASSQMEEPSSPK